MEAAARQPAAPDAQPVSAADRQRRAPPPPGRSEIAVVAGVSDNIYGIDVDKGTQLWKRHFDSTFEEPRRRPRRRPLCPGRPDRDAGDRADGDAGQVHRLRDLVGRPAAHSSTSPPAQELAPPEPFLPPNGKPYALNLSTTCSTRRRRRAAAAIRTSSTRTISRRRRSAASTRAAAACGRGSGPSIGKDGTRLRRQRRRRLLPGAADLRPGDHRA